MSKRLCAWCGTEEHERWGKVEAGKYYHVVCYGEYCEQKARKLMDDNWNTLKKFVRGISMDGGMEDVVHPATEEERHAITQTADAILHKMKEMDGTSKVCDCCGQKIKVKS